MDIRPEWAVKEQIPFTSLSKLSCSVGEPKDLGDYGAVEFYDKAFDKLTARVEKPLERTQVGGGVGRGLGGRVRGWGTGGYRGWGGRRAPRPALPRRSRSPQPRSRP